MKINQVAEKQYELTNGELKIGFGYQKFEDLYYAVPINNTAFLRLLQDEVCETAEERHTLNAMLTRAKDRSAALDSLQQQIQAATL